MLADKNFLVGVKMSFSSEVKEELSRQMSNAQHCRIAEIAAITSMCGNVIISWDNKYSIKMRTETLAVARKYANLIKKSFRIRPEISIRTSAYSNKSRTYTVNIKNHEESLKILQATKLVNNDCDIEEILSVQNNIVIMKNSCKREFLRGEFMATGSINDPNKSYHFEIACNNELKAKQILDILNIFNIEGKTVARKGNCVVYIKEGEGIVDVLNVMEAHVALMKMENVRILKGMSNYYNRQVNCEAANIKKTVNTACRQIDDIQYIIDKAGIDYLPGKLQDIAMVRLENPDSSLQELGGLLEPPLGKSGVNHRLRKISEIADDLRGNTQGGLDQ